MKLLICTYKRPDGTTYTDSRRLDDKADPAAAEAGAERASLAANRNATLISRRVGDSSAVRVASKRNTTIGENQIDPPAESGRDFHAGVQHGDAVGQLEAPVDKPVNQDEADTETVATGAVVNEDSQNDAFAGIEGEADAGDTPPVEPDEADTPSSPSRKKK